jgi:hypothetical protein
MSYAIAHTVLEELWFSIAEELFRRVCVATELDSEQIEALRSVALRPNDFQVEWKQETVSFPTGNTSHMSM